MTEDPWLHRSTGMRCETCMWYLEKVGNAPSEPKKPEEAVVDRAVRIGRCRRHAPTMNGYPVVYENDWCGDHKLNEKAM